MRASDLLQDLRSKDVCLEADGLILRVDAPAGVDVEEMCTILRKHKRALIRLLERELRRLEEAASRGLVIRFSREPGYLSVHDPTTGDWHELPASGCPRWMIDAAKTRRRRKGRTNR